ncbi:MAG TPA: hypothetical protein VFV52_01070 [Bacilli bacterium]|nr:hypothetical protein [Bacilli bacterium]
MKRLRLVPLILLFACTLLIGSLSLGQTALAEKNDSIHVHVKCGEESVKQVFVVYQGARLELEARNAKLFNVEQPGDIVKPDISELIVVKKDGSEQVFAPADDYAGVEGNGTINYWLCVEAGKTAPTTPSNPPTTNPSTPTTPSEPTTSTPSTQTNTQPTTSQPDTDPNATHPQGTDSTVNGGALPNTASPWYNALLAGAALLLLSAAVYWKLGKARG